MEKRRVSNLACPLGPMGPRTGQEPARTSQGRGAPREPGEMVTAAHANRGARSQTRNHLLHPEGTAQSACSASF